MSLPLELIIANAMHASADVLDALPEHLRTAVLKHPDLYPNMARSLLTFIASKADVHTVMACIGTAGGPASLEELAQRWQAVLEARAAEAQRTTKSSIAMPGDLS